MFSVAGGLFVTDYHNAYRPYHYYVLTTLQLFSVIANMLILVVLSEKEMRSAGVNVTMMLIAFCDFVCGSTAVAQLFLRNYTEFYTTYFYAYLQLTCDYLTVAFHASSLYLAAGMAFCRIMSLNLSDKHRQV
uniref:G_PROTEIN_RECEP_F1_2 domain-containing protein n=1 Tax=Caenorhabditis japonica TaxID=281687 RepID=A0A8R1E590_CAEJA